MQSYVISKTAIAFMENLISNGVVLHMPELSVNVNIAGPVPHPPWDKTEIKMIYSLI
jgi:hypothetical protein